MEVLVAQKRLETSDIATFELVGVGGAALPAFTAGSHVDIQLPGGYIRQYSLCNDPSETHRYVVGVLKDPKSRGGSKSIHEQVSEGDTLTISEPRNLFPLVEDAKQSLLLAGGIGVTPILCMAERLSRLHASFKMHYCTRSVAKTAFRDRLSEPAFHAHVSHHYDDGAPDQKLDIPSLLAKQAPETHLYVCGPKGFMDAVLGAARSSGWPESQLHYEFFGAEIVSEDGDSAFEVELALTDRVITVAKDQTVVEALEAEGIELQVSCEQGICGTCLTRVISGVPDHRDMYLTPEEQAANESFLPCCSRSKTARLVLDI